MTDLIILSILFNYIVKEKDNLDILHQLSYDIIFSSFRLVEIARKPLEL